MTSRVRISPRGKELPRLTAEKPRDHLKELLRVENEDVAKVFIIHDELDYLISVLLPLGRRQVAIRKLLAFKKHLDDP